MDLPHNAFTSQRALTESIDLARREPQREIVLAASKHFFDYLSDDGEVGEAYDSYFQNVLGELEQILGDPLFDCCSGRLPQGFPEVAPLYGGLEDDTNFMAVWELDGTCFYLRHAQYDREFPIHIAIGFAGCAEAEQIPGEWSQS